MARFLFLFGSLVRDEALHDKIGLFEKLLQLHRHLLFYFAKWSSHVVMQMQNTSLKFIFYLLLVLFYETSSCADILSH